jgi:hypothetical protein
MECFPNFMCNGWSPQFGKYINKAPPLFFKFYLCVCVCVCVCVYTGKFINFSFKKLLFPYMTLRTNSSIVSLETYFFFNDTATTEIYTYSHDGVMNFDYSVKDY